MKKILLLGLPAVLAVLLIVYGPTLLDAYRLMAFIEQSTEADAANGGPWPQLSDTCAGCHGVNGDSRHQAYPGLAGQPAEYITAQLQRFANGQRANPNMRPLAMTLSEAEIAQLADYYARQPVSRNQWFEPEPALRDKGEQLVAAGGCAACHGEQYMGRERNPRLAAQGYNYLVAQLDAYANGSRTDPTGVMNSLLASTSPEDRRAMASYLASLKPENQGAAQGQE